MGVSHPIRQAAIDMLRERSIIKAKRKFNLSYAQVKSVMDEHVTDDMIANEAEDAGIDLTPEAVNDPANIGKIQKLGDGTFLQFLENVDWGKVLQTVMSIIALIAPLLPKSPAPA